MSKFELVRNFFFETVHQPHAHDVLLVTIITDASLVRIIRRLTGFVRERSGCFYTKERPGSGRNIGMVTLHRDSLHRRSGVVRGAQHTPDAFVFSKDTAGLYGRREKLFGKAEGFI